MRLKIYISIILAIVVIVSLAIISKRQRPEKSPTTFKPLPPELPLTSKPPDYLTRRRIEFPEVEEDPRSRSKMTLNPSGCYGVYISPLEWEMVGNLFVKDVKTGEVKKLTHYRTGRSSTPKAVVWLNDTLLLVIEGYTWGTVTVGGSLYIVDSRTGKYCPILEPPGHQEVAEVSTHKNSIVLRIATHDEERMSYKLSTKILPIDSVLRSLTGSVDF